MLHEHRDYPSFFVKSKWNRLILFFLWCFPVAIGVAEAQVEILFVLSDSTIPGRCSRKCHLPGWIEIHWGHRRAPHSDDSAQFCPSTTWPKKPPRRFRGEERTGKEQKRRLTASHLFCQRVGTKVSGPISGPWHESPKFVLCIRLTFSSQSSLPLLHPCPLNAPRTLRRSGSLISSDLTPVTFRDGANTQRGAAQVELNLISMLVQGCHRTPSPRGVPIIRRTLWPKSRSPKQKAAYEQLLLQPEMLKIPTVRVVDRNRRQRWRISTVGKLSTFSYKGAHKFLYLGFHCQFYRKVLDFFQTTAIGAKRR
jgi:hypothetical protein